MMKIEGEAPAGAMPKLVHRIWLEEGEIPQVYEMYWQAWMRQLPDYAFRTWRAADLAELRSAGLIDGAEGAERKGHIARYDILLTHGGLFLAPEIVPYQPFDPALLAEELVACSEIDSEHYCSVSFLAAAPGARVLAWALEVLQAGPLNQLAPMLETGPGLLRRALAHGPHRLLAPSAFFPYLLDEPMSALYQRDLGATYGIHVWASLPDDTAQQRKRALAYLERGDLKECLQVIAGMGQSDLKPAVDFADAARAARSTALEAAKQPLNDGRRQVRDQAAFDFLKAAFLLMSQVPDVLVWQIGAGDGRASDALRPLLVTFDPPALLLEPNPWLSQTLAANYRNSRNVHCLAVAFHEGAHSLVLHAPDPQKLSEHGLPPAAAGLGSALPGRQAVAALKCGVRDGAALQACCAPIEVGTVGVDGLLGLNGGVMPSIVAVDTEGMDFEVVIAVLAKGIRPFIFHIDCGALPADEIKLMAAALEREFVLFFRGDELVAYRSDFFAIYCDNLYVEHGLPTIHREALAFALALA